MPSKTKFRVTIAVVAILLILFGASVVSSYDAEKSLNSMKDQLAPVITECHNIDVRYTDRDTIAIRQVCPYSDKYIDYGEVKKTLFINFSENKFYRVVGWELL